MTEKKKRNRKRSKQTYVQRSNAVHITLYDPSGGPLPKEIADKAADALWELAKEHGYLIGVATT